MVIDDEVRAAAAGPSGRGPARARSSSNTKAVLVAADLLAVAVGGLVALVLFRTVVRSDAEVGLHLRSLLLTVPFWPAALTHQLLYKARFISRSADEAWRLVKAATTATAAGAAATWFTGLEVYRSWFVVLWLSTLVLVGLERVLARRWFRRARLRGALLRRVVIVGSNAEGQLVREMLDADPGLGYRVVGFLEDLAPADGAGAAWRDPVEALAAVERAGASGVIIAATAIDIGTSNRLIRAFTDHGVHVELSSTLCDITADRLTVRPLGRFPMVYIEPVARGGWRAVAKRGFDLVVAATALLLLAPMLCAIAVAVKLGSPGPVLFRQVRVGQDGELFEILKFRTMVANAESLFDEVRHLNEAPGPLFKIRHDPRVTSVGRFLRTSSLDELPQLVNIVRGDMSLVGPRPALPSEAARWDPSLTNRLRVKPGLTGMWQVSGRSDAAGDYGQLDLYYVDNWDLVTDLVILLRTVPAVLSKKGSY